MQSSGQTEINWYLVRDLVITALWLVFLALVNQKSQFPIYSIFPYLFPVCLLTWRYGLTWGFVFSALASLAAVPGNFMLEHTQNDLFWGGLNTYLKLTCFAFGIHLGKRIADERSKT